VRPLLEIENLRVRYRVMGALKARFMGIADPFLDAVLGVSFAVRPGTTFALVGESGSGKSTLARAIMGLVPAASGQIRFDGAEIGGRADPGLYRHVAMMFQDPIASLSPRLTVKSLITEPFLIHGPRAHNPDAECRRLLDMVGLPANLAGRYPHELSGGQARRVGVARALALAPKLILADEPTAGLDVSVQGEILNLMARLQRELGLTYVVITHNLPVVRHISDDMAIMYLGRFVETGPTDAVFESPAHPYTHGLLAAQPQPDPARRRQQVELQGEVPSPMQRPPGCEFHTRCPRAATRCRGEAPAPRLIPPRAVSCHFPLA